MDEVRRAYFTIFPLYLPHPVPSVNPQEEVTEMLGSDRWFGVTLAARQLSQQLMAEQDPLQALREGQSLVLAGTAQGCLVVMGQSDGEVEFSVAGHEGMVVAMACSPKRNQLVSAGKGQEGEVVVVVVTHLPHPSIFPFLVCLCCICLFVLSSIRLPIYPSPSFQSHALIFCVCFRLMCPF